MDRNQLKEIFGVSKPVIGMLHLLPLPGSVRGSDLAPVRRRLMSDAQALVSGGVNGFILENYGDAPYYPQRVPPHTVAFMTLLGQELSSSFDTPLGVNVLRNDGIAALAVVSAIGARFVRINVLMGARAATEGLIQGEAHQVLQYRRQLGADCLLFADVDVKHSAALGSVSLSGQVEDAVLRGLADAVIVSGVATGKETALEDIKEARDAARGVPVLVGSGATLGNAVQMLAHADGLIVGTGLKKDGITENPVDQDKVSTLLHAVQDSRR